MADTRKKILDRLDVEESDAWGQYSEVIEKKRGPSYEDTEPWAWQRLQAELHRIRRERHRVAV